MYIYIHTEKQNDESNFVAMKILKQKNDFPPRDSCGRKGWFTCAVPFYPLFIIDGLSQIEVVKTATVAELKKSVEAAFSYLQRRTWKGVMVSCMVTLLLCYDGQKLIKDSDYIGDYDIRDGDQLLFVRHLSMNYNLKRTRPVEQVADLEEPQISDTCELGEETNGVVEESCDDHEISTSLQHG